MVELNQVVAGPELVELMDVGRVAELLSCSARHVIRMADAGRMPQPRRIGRLCRWSRAELAAWVAAGCPATRRAGGR